LASSLDLTGGLTADCLNFVLSKSADQWGWGGFEGRTGDGHTSDLLQVDSIVADGRLDVCDGSYIAFVMKKVNGPAQAKLGRGTLVSSNDCARPGRPPDTVIQSTHPA